MRVAFDVGTVRDQPAGVGLYAMAMANALADALPNGDLALIGRRPDAAGLPDNVASAGRSRRLPYPAWVELASARDARRVRADVVHYSDGVVPFVRHGLTIVAVHDLSAVRLWRSHPARRWLRIPLILASPLLADVVLVPSSATAHEVMRFTGVPASKIELAPYAPQVDIRPARDDEVAAASIRYGLVRHRYILALGTIEPRKNHLRLIDAFEQLVAKGRIDDDLRLVIAGKPAWGAQRVLAAIEGSPARSRIDRLGYVPGEDISALVTGAGVVVYASLYEGFGLPVVEAMACGAPTVTSNVSSMPEVAGSAGYLVDPLDTASIARGILDAMSAGEMDREGVASRSITQAATFSWQRTARTVVEIYAIRLS